MIPEIERLSGGLLMAFTAAELKTLRSVKGDPARREYVVKRAKTRENTFEFEDAWEFIDHMSGSRPFVGGKRLHQGQMSRLQLLDLDTFVAALNTLPNGEADLAKAFDAMDEPAFHYRYVPFWTADKWKAAGITTLKTAARRAQIVEKLIAARVFIDATTERGEQLLFFTDYRS